MTDEDIGEILSIDKRILGEQRVVTYSDSNSTYLGGEVGLSKVAEWDGQVIGFAIGRVVAHPYRIEYIAFLSLIGILPEFQRKGVGKRLMDAFLKTCQERNITSISTLIDLDDPTMLSFFRSMGFQQSKVAEFTKNLRLI